MRFFVDTADVAELEKLIVTGMVDGVTTNPSLIAKSGRNILEVTKEIASMVSGPVSAEVTATDYDTMLEEGLKLAGIAENIAVKVPLTVDGLRTCKTLSDRGTMVNVTLCFSAAQALLAAKAGASFISPFVGRLDDMGMDGMELIESIREIYDAYPTLNTDILVASIRNTRHVERAAEVGADVGTLPPRVIWDMYQHPLTSKGLDDFMADWAKTGQSIL
ncbi:MAG: fructose-6-phosphate aldolase [Alphaproteobacteria bacterium]